MAGYGKTDDSDHQEMVNVGSNSFLVDVMSPYFIGPSDNLGQLYVSELLRDGNYGDWVREMSNTLFTKNKIGFVDGTITLPADGTKELSYWLRCNAMVHGWLTTAMDKEIRLSVKFANTARDIWVDLEERFGMESASRAYELRRVIAMIRQDKLSVSSYYTKLRGLWDEIHSVAPIPKCKCGGRKCEMGKKLATIVDRERLYEFLMGLNDDYGTVKTHVLSSKPTLSLGAAYHLVAEDKQHKLISAARKPTIDAATFQIFSNNRREPEHQEKKTGRDRYCTHCHRSNHTIKTCFRLGYSRKDDEEK